MTEEEILRKLSAIDEFLKALDLFPWGDEESEDAE